MRSQNNLKKLYLHFYDTYSNQIWLGAGSCTLEININSEFKQTRGILLFNHEKHYIFTTTVPMVTKFSTMVIYHDDGLLIIKSHNTLKTRSCRITWQPKIIISPQPECLWPPNLVGWWFILKSSYPQSYQNLCSHDLVSSRDKLKPLYLLYCSAYDHQVLHKGN